MSPASGRTPGFSQAGHGEEEPLRPRLLVSRCLGFAHCRDLLSQYRAGRIGLGQPVSVLRAWILRFDEPYLAGQRLFFPYPASLLSPRDSGHSEDR